MTDVGSAEVLVRPFGPGGAELGMSRAEMMEHIHYLGEVVGTTYDTQLQIFFAWLVAMFFVAHRLSKPQFIVVSLLFTYFTWSSWTSLYAGQDAFIGWQEYAGLYHAKLEPVGAPPNLIYKAMYFMRDLDMDNIYYWAVYIACMWFGVSCRNNQPKEVGSPL